MHLRHTAGPLHNSKRSTNIRDKINFYFTYCTGHAGGSPACCTSNLYILNTRCSKRQINTMLSAYIPRPLACSPPTTFVGGALPRQSGLHACILVFATMHPLISLWHTRMQAKANGLPAPWPRYRPAKTTCCSTPCSFKMQTLRDLPRISP